MGRHGENEAGSGILTQLSFMGAATWIVVLSIALLLPNWRVLLALFEEEHVGNGLRAFSPSVQDWRMKGAYMRYKDHLIFTYRSNFNTMAPIKRTLLLLHGFPTCSFDFVPILAELEAMYVTSAHNGFLQLQIRACYCV